MNKLLLIHIIIIWYHQDHRTHSVYTAVICFVLALVLVITIVYHYFSVCPYYATYSFAMKVEAASSSETAAYLLYHTVTHPKR